METKGKTRKGPCQGSHGRRQSESGVTVQFEWNLLLIKRRLRSPGKRWRMDGQAQRQWNERLRLWSHGCFRISCFRSAIVLVCLESINTIINKRQLGPILTHKYYVFIDLALRIERQDPLSDFSSSSGILLLSYSTILQSILTISPIPDAIPPHLFLPGPSRKHST